MFGDTDGGYTVNWEHILPLLAVVSSFATGCIIFLLGTERVRTRTFLNVLGAVLMLVFVGFMLFGVSQEIVFQSRYSLAPGIYLAFHADPFSLLFLALSAILWLLTTVYAIGYLEHSPHRNRFFGFFSLCVSATAGIALSANLFTFLVFYEMLTLTTYPLVVHRGTGAAIRGGGIYLAYTIAGGAILFLAIVWLQTILGSIDFTEGGIITGIDDRHATSFRCIFTMLIVGFGVKAALVPLHGWLPEAMVAPAPVSALLHAVAVVKAGAFGIVRVVYDVYGVETCSQLGVAAPLAVAASITILYGSMRAVFQDDLKRRLAYSTVSQVSYIALGAALVGPLGTIGGVVHLVHQGLMKITLFFAAGNLAETLGVHKISEMNGTARRMPLTMAAFTIGALGMIGVPPIAGFVSKWFIGRGAAADQQWWVIFVLIGSTILNAIYFLPIIYAAWFKEPDGSWPHDHHHSRFETHLPLLVPPIVTALFAVLAGLLAEMPFSPLDWAQFIVSREYRP